MKIKFYNREFTSDTFAEWSEITKNVSSAVINWSKTVYLMFCNNEIEPYKL